MLKHVELDPTRKLEEQFSDKSGQTTILINVFNVDSKDHEAFKRAWAEDAAFFKRQPGYISAQLHQGIEGSSMFLNYAVFENTAAFAASGGLLKGITDSFPDVEPVNRMGNLNAMDDPRFAAAVKATGRRKIILSGITTDFCLVYPALSLIRWTAATSSWS